MEVRMEHLRPREIEARMDRCPVLFMPLGTIEWHGRHNVVGLDAVKAHELCVRAAREAGGIVAPPLYGGMGGLDEPHTFVIEPEDSLVSNIVRPWLEQACREAIRQGFKAVIMLTGHYGASQQMIVRGVAVRITRELKRPILGTPEYFLALDENYFGDHAAFFETSLMMHLYPESVDLGQLGDEPHQGVGGRDPKKYANPKDGKRLADAIIRRLVDLARRMPNWDADTIRRFANAEEALVERQHALARETGCVWAGWRNIDKGVLSAYPKLLTTEHFEEIAALTLKL
jgi:creatinine amidohydrolase